MKGIKKRRSLIENEKPTTKYQPIKAKFTTKSGIKKPIHIIPRNIHQEEYLEYLLDPEKMIIIANGFAGTGKTLLGMLAGIKALSEKKVNKIILCRPSVGVDDENLGFLPGDIDEKMGPWVQPLVDILLEYYPTKDLEKMIESKIIEFLPLMYMRGRNIKNAFVILDEAQNTVKSQMLCLCTRLCEGSKLVITGDNNQSDKQNGENGLYIFKNAIEKYGKSKYIASVEFGITDIERHPVVTEVLNIFKNI
jgi:phosphate starvation-inducible protein PhoH and related proteins